MHHVLFYEVISDFATQRERLRDAHLRAAWDAVERGDLILGGAFGEPSDGAMLLFNGNAGAAERFAASDPYVIYGLVQNWTVRRWNTVVGSSAAKQVRPSGI